MVVELGKVLEIVVIDFGKLIQRIEAVLLNERLDILREEIKGRSIVRKLGERVELVGLIFISFLGIEVARCGEGHKRDGFVVDAFFYFEPVQRFEYSGDMFSFFLLVPLTAE